MTSPEELYQSQLETFELARTNYSHLKNVKWRTIKFSGFDIRLQYNPVRILSTNARIDATTLKERRCFLCPGNMPEEQKGISWNSEYNIFINPYPIFEKHFTAPTVRHTPQQISGRFEDMLALALDLPGYTVFYNGPQCGASAPDHFHFQLAPHNSMPLETDVENTEIRETLIQSSYYSVATLHNYLRKVLVIKASDLSLLSRLFKQISDILSEYIPSEPEPMYNLLAWFDNCQWSVCIFPRRLLRPWQFFAEGEQKILFSPGSVDMAGLIIAPRHEDFERYSPEVLTDLFDQVSPDNETWNKITNRITQLNQ